MARHVSKTNSNDKQSTKQKLIILVNTNLKAFETVDLPVQFCPSPINPGLQVHTNDPRVLLHAASSWHLRGFVSHSSISVVKSTNKQRKKKF